MIHLTIGPRYECAQAATKYGAEYVISIQDFEDQIDDHEPKPLGIAPEKHKHFFFDDLTEAVPARYSSRDPEIIRDRCPTMKDVEDILTFFKTIPDDSRVYVHCFAGVSRSTATAFILYCYQLGPGKEEEAMLRTNKSAPYGGIWPNELIVEFGDTLLGRNGAMNRALRAWKDSVLEEAEERNRISEEERNTHIGRIFGPDGRCIGRKEWDTLQEELKIDKEPEKE